MDVSGPDLLFGFSVLSNDQGMTAVMMEKENRRSGFERRQRAYTAYVPERRSGRDRRSIFCGKQQANAWTGLDCSGWLLHSPVNDGSMSVSFSVNQADGYFTTHYSGTPSVNELVHAWEVFILKVETICNLNALVDFERIAFAEMPEDSIRFLADFAREFHRGVGCPAARKVAIHAPSNLPDALRRTYDALHSEAPDALRIFRHINRAKQWLKVSSS